MSTKNGGRMLTKFSKIYILSKDLTFRHKAFSNKLDFVAIYGRNFQDYPYTGCISKNSPTESKFNKNNF